MTEKIKNASLLIGDPLLVEEKARTIEKSISETCQGEIVHQKFNLSETSLDAVLVEARTLPFLTEAQIFHIRDLQKVKKADREALERYLEDPFKSTFLLFEDASLSKTDDFTKLIKKKGTVYFFESQDQKSVAQSFIRQKVKAAGKTIAPQAATMLEHEIGDSPSLLDSMLERLINYAGDQAQITAQMVQTLDEDWSQNDIFKMTNAIADKKTGYAMELLKEQLEENNQDVLGLLGILHWQVRRLWLGSVLYEEKAPQSIILKKCKVSPRQAPFFMKQLQRFSRKQMERTLEGLFQIDWKVKTGRAEGPTALESWLVEVTT